MNDPVALSRALLEGARGQAGISARDRLRLEELDPAQIDGDDARIAFWLNLYNALVLAELAERPLRGSLLRHRSLFTRELVCVGGHGYSLDAIEHGVLRLNARPPARPRRPFGARDPRRQASPSGLDPRIHFALNCGAVSCPGIRPYGESDLRAELERATVAYVTAETRLDRERGRLVLPFLLRLYRGDFDDRVAFVVSRLGDDDRTWIGANRPRASYGRFDWTFTGAG